MEIYNLKPTHQNKKRVRIGRGGKRGTYSGKGQKGQKSRAGHRLKSEGMQIILKMPKLKGLKNKSKQKKPIILRVKDLEKISINSIINKNILFKAGIIKKESDPVKILDGGDIKKAVTIEKIPVSNGAKIKIEKSGGSIK